eukprot:GILK01020033.1.p1 GENE.GILK01020033.1~~GILK01020033.1.p1  ORF type:complete len:239 (-),score=17.79 GILK01020033.1:463-1086(-)
MDPVLPFAFVFVVLAENISDVLAIMRAYFGLVASDLTTIRSPTDQDVADLSAFTSTEVASEDQSKLFVIGFSSVSDQAVSAGYNFSKMVLGEESMPTEINSTLNLIAPAAVTSAVQGTSTNPPEKTDNTLVYVLVAVLVVVVVVAVVALVSIIVYRRWRHKKELELDSIDAAEMGQMGQSQQHSADTTRAASYAVEDPPGEVDEYYV